MPRAGRVDAAAVGAELSPAPPQRQQGPSRRALLSAFTWTEPGAKARGRRTSVPCRRRSRSGRVTSAGDVSPLRSRSWRRWPRLRTEAGHSRGPRSPRFPRVSIPFLAHAPAPRVCAPLFRPHGDGPFPAAQTRRASTQRLRTPSGLCVLRSRSQCLRGRQGSDAESCRSGNSCLF